MNFKTTCKQGHTGIYFCGNKDCQENNIICIQLECPSRIDHLGCLHVYQQFIFKSWATILQQTSITYKITFIKITQIVNQMVLKLNYIRDRLQKLQKGYGLDEFSVQLHQLLTSNKIQNIKGNLVLKVYQQITNYQKFEIQSIQNFQKSAHIYFQALYQSLQKFTKRIYLNQKKYNFSFPQISIPNSSQSKQQPQNKSNSKQKLNNIRSVNYFKNRYQRQQFEQKTSRTISSSEQYNPSNYQKQIKYQEDMQQQYLISNQELINLYLQFQKNYLQQAKQKYLKEKIYILNFLKQFAEINNLTQYIGGEYKSERLRKKLNKLGLKLGERKKYLQVLQMPPQFQMKKQEIIYQ